MWWVGAANWGLFLNALTLGEIRESIEGVRQRDPVRAIVLETWLSEVTKVFGSRVLTMDAARATARGRMAAVRTVPTSDALSAVTARVLGLALVTRNAADVEGQGVPVLYPFVVTPR
ncbi:type II toxin-antitoxin system VapC family toxin [Roseicella sp. DB1501]|uniref:type II toxin-antitoxin system VapC family toxin n=1 Tax=Roseicella sp. DB1501 TaxID=2730925 RepID=UPI00149252A4|nr:type II toxin-antitoxin system VapC family toxin [Roseicella sp. DB1501]